MSRAKKFILIPAALLIVTFVGLFVFINPLLEKAKPMLLDTVSKTLGSEVSASKISVNFLPAPGFLLEDVSMADGDKKLSVGKVNINISISDAMKGIITLVSAEISKVTLGAKLLEDGSVAIDGIKLPKPQADTQAQAAQVTAPVSAENQKQGLALAIEKLEVSDVNVNVLNAKTKSSLPIELRTFSFKKDGEKGKIDATVKLPKGDITVDGSVPSYKIDPKNLKVSADVAVAIDSFEELTAFVGTDVSKFNIKNLRTNIAIDLPKVEIKDLMVNVLEQKINLKGVLQDHVAGGGNFQLDIDSFDIAALRAIHEMLKTYTGSLQKLACTVALKAKEEVSPECTLGASNVRGVQLAIPSLKAKSRLLDPKTFNLENLDLHVAGGTIKVLADGVPGGTIKTKVSGGNLSIPELQKLAPAYDDSKPSSIEGNITSLASDMTLQGQNKSGSFSVQIAPLSIKGVNIFKKVADAFDIIPALGLSLGKAMPAAYAAVLVSQNTDFQTIKVSGSIANSRITLSDFQAISKGYRVIGKGVIDSGNIDLDTSFVMDAALVSAIESNQPKIANVKNADGTIVVPLKIKKDAADSAPLILPDMENLAKQQLGVQLKNNAKKALDKVTPGLGGVVDGLFN